MPRLVGQAVGRPRVALLISGCFCHECGAILSNQACHIWCHCGVAIGFPFHVHGTSNLKCTVEEPGLSQPIRLQCYQLGDGWGIIPHYAIDCAID